MNTSNEPPSAKTETPPENTSARVRREIAASVLVGGVAPYVVYTVLRPHAGEVTCLIVGGLLPVAWEFVSLARHRHLDPLSTLNIVALAANIALVITGGSARLILVKESFVTGAIGVGFLLSLLGRRPAQHYLGRQFVTGNIPANVARYEAAWDKSPTMRRMLRTMTATWGVVMVLELVLRLVMVFQLTTEQMLVLGPVVFYGITAALIWWTVTFTGRLKPTILAERAASTDASTSPGTALARA